MKVRLFVLPILFFCGLLLIPCSPGSSEGGPFSRRRVSTDCQQGGTVLFAGPSIFRTGSTAQSIKVIGYYTAGIGPNSGDRVEDDNAMVRIEVDAPLTTSDGYTTTDVKIKKFSDSASADSAPVGPVPDDAIPLQKPTSGTIWINNNVPVNAPTTDPGMYNNYIVVWTTSTSGGEYYQVQRYPAKGATQHGWRIINR
jgi:hypothetical protein